MVQSFAFHLLGSCRVVALGSQLYRLAHILALDKLKLLPVVVQVLQPLQLAEEVALLNNDDLALGRSLDCGMVY